MGRHCCKDWCRDSLPVGTIRERRRKHGRVRMIKICLDGPRSRRWVNYAKWWWELHVAPVPAGMRVCHLDGNTLNDKPANYSLMTAGDVAFMWHDRNPEGSQQNYAKCRTATA